MRINWLSGIYIKKYLFFIICKLCYKSLHHKIYNKCVYVYAYVRTCVRVCMCVPVCKHIYFPEIWLLPEHHCTESQ